MSLAVFIVILYDQKGVDKGNRKEEKTTVSIVELVVLCNDNIIIDMIFCGEEMEESAE